MMAKSRLRKLLQCHICSSDCNCYLCSVLASKDSLFEIFVVQLYGVLQMSEQALAKI